MEPSLAKTAVVLLGYQRDFFSENGLLHSSVDECFNAHHPLPNTIALLDALAPTEATLLKTPIHFSANYGELENPCGLLAIVRDTGALQRGTEGGEMLPEIEAYGRRIQTVEGKTGFNAFHGTDLDSTLKDAGIENILLAGVVTSVCVDSTARAASEKGYNVTVLRDCTAGRSITEHEFYCDEIFPLYANVSTLSDYLLTHVQPLPKVA